MIWFTISTFEALKIFVANLHDLVRRASADFLFHWWQDSVESAAMPSGSWGSSCSPTSSSNQFRNEGRSEGSFGDWSYPRDGKNIGHRHCCPRPPSRICCGERDQEMQSRLFPSSSNSLWGLRLLTVNCKSKLIILCLEAQSYACLLKNKTHCIQWGLFQVR